MHLRPLGSLLHEGIGNVRHLDTNHLRIQEMSARKRLEYNKVVGTQNPADLMTKELSFPEIEKYAQVMGSAFAEGSHEIASKVATDESTCDRPGEADPVHQVTAKEHRAQAPRTSV